MRKLRFPKLASVLVAACCLLQPGTAAPEKPVRRVLIFYELGVSSPAVALVDREIRTALEQTPYQIELYAEYLETALFPDAASQQKFREWYILKYKRLKPDVILAVGPSPLKFMVESHEKFFRDIPVVFCATTPEQAGSPKLNSSFAGVWINFDPAKTLEVALQLQPSTKHVVVVGGSGSTDRMLVGIVRGTLRRYEEKVEITYLTDQAMSAFLDRLKRLPPNTIIFYTLIRQDATGKHFIPATQSVPMITAVANAPVFVTSDSLVGTGAVGGYVHSYAALGQIASRIATRILAGERPQDIPIETDSNLYMFDWSVLRRWGLKESGVPPGSILLNRQRSLWESYKYYIIAGILLCVIETLLILGLLWQRSTRRKAQQSLVERMAFEKILSELSKTFINLPEEQVGATIQQSLGRIGEFLTLSRITLFDYSQESRELTVAFSWCGKGVENPPAVTRINQLPWFSDRLLRGDSILLSDLNFIPEKASLESDYLTRMGAVSVAAIPLRAGDEFFGCISYVSTKRRVQWTEDRVEQLKLLAEVFSNALMRQRALDARLRHAAIVDSSDDAIVSMNLNGIIVSWNAAAQRLFGYSEAEAIGRPITMLIPHELRDEEHLFHQRLMDGEHVQRYETVRVVKGREKVAVALTISPVRDSTGNLVGFSEIARDITDRKRVEHILRESEERFRLVANSAPVLIWMSGTDKLCNFFNQGWLSFTGRSMAEELGEGWASGVHPDDLENCLKIYSASFDARVDFEMEYRLRRFDGEYRWLVDYGVPRFETDGAFCGYIGSCVDISERKSSEEALQALSGRLIHAQEEERARIARDLHDDFSQSLALQCIDLEQLLKKLAKTETDERTRLLKMLKRTKQMTADIRALSHQLHSNKLEYVGLVPAVSGLCKEISEKYEIQVRFTESGFPQNIPKDVALCLFRVAQEAIGNVVKHSQAKSAEVELSANSNGVSLRITDEGKGFAPHDTSREGGGLGLVGMTERLRLVGGRLLIRSELMQGTSILAEVPMSAFPTEGQLRTVAAGGTEA
jgi:PAS domain S-box-containing protein